MSIVNLKELCYSILDAGLHKKFDMTIEERKSFNHNFYVILKSLRKHRKTKEDKEVIEKREVLLTDFVEHFGIEGRDSNYYSYSTRKRIQKGNSSQYKRN